MLYGSNICRTPFSTTATLVVTGLLLCVSCCIVLFVLLVDLQHVLEHC